MISSSHPDGGSVALIHAAAMRAQSDVLDYLRSADVTAAAMVAAEAELVRAEAAVATAATQAEELKAAQEGARGRTASARDALRQLDRDVELLGLLETKAILDGTPPSDPRELLDAKMRRDAQARVVDVVAKLEREAAAAVTEFAPEETASGARLVAARFEVEFTKLEHTAVVELQAAITKIAITLAATEAAASNDVHARRTRRLRDAMAREVVGIMPTTLHPHIGPGRPVAKQTSAENEAMVTLRVRPGDRYGAINAGELVQVSEREARNQLRVGRYGEPLGALELPEEAEARTAQKAKATEATKGSAISQVATAIDSALDRLFARSAAEGEQKAKAKADAERQAANLERLVTHLAAQRAADGGKE